MVGIPTFRIRQCGEKEERLMNDNTGLAYNAGSSSRLLNAHSRACLFNVCSGARYFRVR